MFLGFQDQVWGSAPLRFQSVSEGVGTQNIDVACFHKTCTQNKSVVNPEMCLMLHRNYSMCFCVVCRACCILRVGGKHKMKRTVNKFTVSFLFMACLQ